MNGGSWWRANRLCGQRAYAGSAVAPAARIPLGRVGQIASPNPGVNVRPAKQMLISSATPRALVRALLRYHGACNDVSQDLWSQRREGGRVPSRSILPLLCSGCGDTALVWVH